MPHVSCTMHHVTTHANCTMHCPPTPHVSHSIHQHSPHLSNSTDTHGQIKAAHNNLMGHDDRREAARTPKRNHKEKDRRYSRNTSGGDYNHNPSRSRSLPRRATFTPSRRCQSPPSYSRATSPQRSPSKSSFPSGASTQGHAVCTLCLAIDPHDTRKCRSEVLWDGSKARCRKNDEGRLITPVGMTLCSDWNNRRGCTSNTHEHCHKCSGCGNKDHRAQRCPQAQKKAGAHSL